MGTTQNTGTSIHVLQAYPLGTLEVETPNGRGILIGLRLSQDGDRFIPNVDCFNDGIGNGYFMREVTPVLRPFSQLCTPLEDGTVPAKCVASLLVNDWAARYSFEIDEIVGNRVTVRVLEWDHEFGEQVVARVSILADWNLLVQNDENQVTHGENLLEAYEYLRQNHFAVGLDASQFIEKAPAPTPSTIQQKGGGEQ